jgi:hypothetical protein
MKIIATTMLLASFFCSPLVLAQTNGCDAKRQSIENELAYAQAHGNKPRIEGLQKALSENKAHCTDASLQRDADQKVTKAQEKLTERQSDLDKAKADGKSAKKIADRQHKVDEAHAELQRAILDAKQ